MNQYTRDYGLEKPYQDETDRWVRDDWPYHIYYNDIGFTETKAPLIEILLWVRENIRECNDEKLHAIWPEYVSFKKEEHAVLFRLRWG